MSQAVFFSRPYQGVTSHPRSKSWGRACRASCALSLPTPPLGGALSAPADAAHPTGPTKPVSWSGRGPHSAGVGVVSTAGITRGLPKPHNQDAFVVQPLHPAPSVSATLIAVLDGHGQQGHYAAQHFTSTLAEAAHACARQQLLGGSSGGGSEDSSADGGESSDGELGAGGSNLAKPSALSIPPLDFDAAAAKSCLREAFARVAESVHSAECDMVQSGSTAVAALVLHDSVVVAWVGDSRAVVGTPVGGSYAAIPLTDDHRPDKLSETARILAAGGWLAQAAVGGDPYRVCLPQPKPNVPCYGLTVARAFGDLLLSPAGVIPTPDLSVYRRAAARHGAAAGSAAASSAAAGQQREESALPDVLVLASDGLWEVMSNEEAVEIAARAPTPEQAAQWLADMARLQWELRFGGRHADDITVAVAFLP